MENKIIRANELFREYDGLIGLTMLNLWTMSKDHGVIRLYNFNRKNTEHLYILRVALMARALYDLPVEVEGSGWDIFRLNWKIRKGFDKIKRYKLKVGENDSKGVNVPMLLDFMRKDGIDRCGDSFSFADIYNCYYEGSLN